MAFWSSWFAPTCIDCQDKITEGEPVEVDGGKVCATCHAARVQAEADRQAELEARRLAEEEARRKFEDNKRFGADDRY